MFSDTPGVKKSEDGKKRKVGHKWCEADDVFVHEGSSSHYEWELDPWASMNRERRTYELEPYECANIFNLVDDLDQEPCAAFSHVSCLLDNNGLSLNKSDWSFDWSTGLPGILSLLEELKNDIINGRKEATDAREIFAWDIAKEILQIRFRFMVELTIYSATHHFDLRKKFTRDESDKYWTYFCRVLALKMRSVTHLLDHLRCSTSLRDLHDVIHHCIGFISSTLVWMTYDNIEEQKVARKAVNIMLECLERIEAHVKSKTTGISGYLAL